jgi:trehalose 6-phosphate synthase
VAKEGPLINTRHGVLALSREAGAFDQLAPAVREINPFDVSGTASELARALDTDDGQKAAWSEQLKTLILARDPADWLNDQLGAAR